jgi:hypothetical protein
MHNALQPRRDSRSRRAPASHLPGLAFALLLAACSGRGYDSSTVPTPEPAPTPTPIVANTVVAYPSETGELTLYAGQSQQITLSFRTSDGGSATQLALALPAGGLPAG